MEAERLILDAIEAKQKINVIYHGGSMSGQPRQLGPISIKGNKLRAKCYKSDAFKTFVIDKIQVITSDGELTEKRSPNTHSKLVIEPEQTLLDVSNAIQPHFDDKLWLVELNEDNKSLYIYPRFKNGKPKKSVDLALFYEEYRTELVLNETTDEFEDIEIKRVKPWLVSCKNKTTTSFGSLNKATAKFFEWGKELLGDSSVQFKFTECATLKYLKLMWPTDSKSKIKRELAEYPSVYFNSALNEGSFNNDSWFYQVPYTFRDALDIKYEQRVKDKKPYMVWTQGPILKFKMGDTFPSKNGISTIQVQYGEQMGWDREKDEMFLGSVVFDLFEHVNNQYFFKQRYQCDQMMFLQLLITGEGIDRFTKLTRSLNY
ncbi:hypothetical protein EXT43_12650 [Pseudoalteromonas sp. CO109Y]|uniref:hypothetical protein n=1 Tax=Pseudoalteromonas sp. CO109Y TaxID=1777235 RepID=UPI001023CABE|nr:hypothetical protein [Pseudoalteromonas sp. CO109Y]RZF81281.1 hypothetical protein EXT43_12650 [Pseudoalteromonas sp. CO109Y]